MQNDGEKHVFFKFRFCFNHTTSVKQTAQCERRFPIYNIIYNIMRTICNDSSLYCVKQPVWSSRILPVTFRHVVMIRLHMGCTWKSPRRGFIWKLFFFFSIILVHHPNKVEDSHQSILRFLITIISYNIASRRRKCRMCDPNAFLVDID